MPGAEGMLVSFHIHPLGTGLIPVPWLWKLVMVLTPTAASGYSICHSGTNCAQNGQRALPFIISYFFTNIYWGIPGGSAIKNLPAMQEMQVQSLGSALQYSCLKKPMNRGDWWATVHGFSKCQTELKQLSMYARYVLSAQRDELAPSLVEERG